jgi:hypothetical protein
MSVTAPSTPRGQMIPSQLHPLPPIYSTPDKLSGVSQTHFADTLRQTAFGSRAHKLLARRMKEKLTRTTVILAGSPVKEDEEIIRSGDIQPNKKGEYEVKDEKRKEVRTYGVHVYGDHGEKGALYLKDSCNFGEWRSNERLIHFSPESARAMYGGYPGLDQMNRPPITQATASYLKMQRAFQKALKVK